MALPQDSKSQLSLYIWVIEVFIAIAAISFIIFLCLIPKYPVCTFTNADIPPQQLLNLTCTNVNATGNTSCFMVTISNPNKGMIIYYDPINITLDFNGSIIGKKSLPSFIQGYRMQCQTSVYVLRDGKTGGIRACLETSVKFKFKIFGTKTKYRPVQFQANVPVDLNGSVAAKRTTGLQLNQERCPS